jgi:acyl-CoA synthetase (AMP-forming)/AMP-acid ligase II
VEQVTSSNLADRWEEVALLRGTAPAVIQGERSVPWTAFEQRSELLAHTLEAAGLRYGDRVALMLRNSPEYLEATFASLKQRLVPVNTNFRYHQAELIHVWSDSGARAVVFHTSLGEQVAAVRLGLANVKLWLAVDDGPPVPSWAVDYGRIVEQGVVPVGTGALVTTRAQRSDDDVIILYTGGTTGLPKGVIWRQGDVLGYLRSLAPEAFPPAGGGGLAQWIAGRAPQPHLAATPLMHASGAWSSYGALARGDTVVLLEGRSFAAAELLTTIDRCGVVTVNIVGEAFGAPLCEALMAQPERWQLGTLRSVVSTGAALSSRTKRFLRELLPLETRIVEVLSSSEAVGMAAVSSDDPEDFEAGRLRPRAGVRVLSTGMTDVVPGSGEVGIVATRQFLPVGYHGAPEATADTFPILNGVRFALSGDFASVNADGSLCFVGRGSQVINTGGEKVYTGEVESVIQRLEGVSDVAVFAVPDPRLGSVVAAAVVVEQGATLDADLLTEHVRAVLASYKVPRLVAFVAELPRLISGKLDPTALRNVVEAQSTFTVSPR